MIVTSFKNLNDTKTPYYRDVNVIFNLIKTGGNHGEIVDKIRSAPDKEEKDRLKRSLPITLFSGKFKARKIEALEEYNRLVVLDLDNLKNVDVKRFELEQLPFVYACWVSPSGNGLKVLVKVLTENHAGHFLALSKEISGVDQSGKDISRATFLSKDEKIYINDKAAIYDKVIVASYSDEQKYENLKKWLENKGSFFVDGNRNSFITKLSSAANRFGIDKDFLKKRLEDDFLTGSDFSKREMEATVNGIYQRYQDQYSSVDAEEVWTDDKIKAVLADDVKTSDVIYLKDVASDIIKDYEEGISKGPTTHFPSIDKIFRRVPGQLNVLTGIGNHGKALCLETDIPTIDGWKKMKDIQVGDKVFDENGKPCNVTAVTDVMYDRPCYQIDFKMGHSVIADAEHEWLTNTDQSRRSYRTALKNDRVIQRDLKSNGSDQTHKRTYPSVKTTRQIAETLFFKKGGNDFNLNHGIDLCKPVEFDEKVYPIHPYVLGYWLGNGHSTASTITTADPWISEYIQSLGYEVAKSKAQYGYTIYGLLPELRKLGLYNNKHIPLEYLRGSVTQRLELLRGLMDSDGYVSKDSKCEFCVIKKDLALGVYELVTSLGMKTGFIDCEARLNGRYISQRYRLHFCPTVQVFNLPRKKERCTKFTQKNNHRTVLNVKPVESVPVKCIQVDSPNRLYLCTRSYIPTHNSQIHQQLDLVDAAMSKGKFGYFTPEGYPPKRWYRQLIHSLVGKPTDPTAKNRMSKQELERAMDFIHSNFIYIYPPDLPTPEYIMERFAEAIIKHGLKGVTVDPFNQLNHDLKKRDDVYLAEVLSKFERFAQQQQVLMTIITHPNRTSKGDDDNYKAPDVYDLNGGPVWNARATNIYTYHRPKYSTDPSDTTCQLIFRKIKDQEIMGVPGTVELQYDRNTFRFYDNGFNPLTKFVL